MTPPDHLDPNRHALFLDFDGTLADIVDNPFGVRVDPATLETLAGLQQRFGGAFAIITGREIADVDRVLAPHRFAIAGVHGTTRRDREGHVHNGSGDRTAADVFVLAADLRRDLDHHDGIILEPKSSAVAIHYRQRPELGPACIEAARRAVASMPGFTILPGKMVIEILKSGADKGQAILAYLNEDPYRGRRPVFAGDDVTDEAGFIVVNERGGLSIKIGGGETLARYRVETAKQLRDWLMGLVNSKTGGASL